VEWLGGGLPRAGLLRVGLTRLVLMRRVVSRRVELLPVVGPARAAQVRGLAQAELTRVRQAMGRRFRSR